MDWIIMGVLIAALIITLITSLLDNHEVLFSDVKNPDENENKILSWTNRYKNLFYFLIIWGAAGIVFIISHIFPERIDVMLIFYASMGFYVPKIPIYQLNINKYKKEINDLNGYKLAAENINKCKEELNELKGYKLDAEQKYKNYEVLLKQISSELITSDILFDLTPQLEKSKANRDELINYFENKSKNYIEKGLLTETTATDYNTSIKIRIDYELVHH